MAVAYQDKRTAYQQDLDLHSELLSHRSLRDEAAREIADNILPFRTNFFLTERDRSPHNGNILSSWVPLAARTCMSGLSANVTSPAAPWAVFGVDDDTLEEDGEVKSWLSYVNKTINRIFDLSNFYREMPNHYLDISCFGTAVTLVESDVRDIVRFETLSWGSYVLGVNGRGEVDTIIREEEFTVRQLVPRFCRLQDDGNYDTSNLSPRTAQAWNGGSRTQAQKVTVLHVIKPNPDHDPNRPESRYKEWLSRYCEKGQGVGYDKHLRVSGFDYFPALVSRWNVRSGEIYGSGHPGEMVIQDIKQLYQATEDESHGIEMYLDPPLIGPSRLSQDMIQRLPGGVTNDDTPSEKGGLRPLFEIGLDLRWLQANKAELREIINRGFFVDTLMAAQTLRQKVTGQITATEFQVLADEKMIEFGPVSQSFFIMLRQCLDIVFSFAMEAGEIPPPPDVLAGHSLPPKFISPLARAQRVALLGPIERMLSVVERIISAGYTPIVDKIDLDQVIDEIAKILNIPAGMIRPDDLVAQIRAERAKSEAATRAAEQAKTVSSAAKDLSQTPVTGDSMLNLLIRQSQAGSAVPTLKAA